MSYCFVLHYNKTNIKLKGGLHTLDLYVLTMNVSIKNCIMIKWIYNY